MNKIPPSLRVYLAAIALIAATTLALWMFRGMFTRVNFAVCYMLAVLVIGVWQGTRPSLVAALLSFLCFNYFLTRPYYTFWVADPHDLLDLFVYFACAAISGQLASYARRQAESNRQLANEQIILYQLTSSLNQTTDTQGVYRTLKQVLEGLSTVTGVEILPHRAEMPLASPAKLYLLLRVGDEIFGVLGVAFDSPPVTSLVQLITVCAVQTSVALQRIELAARAQRSRNFEEADRLKTALLHAVSHDLRTPITIIKTSVSNLLTFYQTVPESERVDMLRVIENEADQLNKMVGNLLDISRLKAGALQINRQWNSLEEVAGDVAARVWQLTHQERIRMVFPPTMPLVSFDYGLMLQVLSNLAENSLRYEPSDRQIEIASAIDGDEVRTWVRNHGPAIPVEERELIMEPFYHGTGGNIGLGLAIAKGIVEAHGGRLWVEDTPGGGASFVFSLPYAPGPERHIPA